MAAPIAVASTKGLPREEWLALRKRGIGGSDVATILGINPHKSALALWMEKSGMKPDDEAGEPAEIGNLLEDDVAELFERRTGLKARRCNRLLQHPAHPWMLANIDREIVASGRPILECKTAGAARKDEWSGDEVPLAYMAQVQHYLAVTGRQKAYIAVIVPDYCLRFVWKEIERDDDLIGDLIEAEARFWNLVESGTMPEPDGSESARQALRALYPKAVERKKVDLPPSTLSLIEQREALKQAAKEAEKRVDAAEDSLKAMLGDAEIGICGTRTVLWTNTAKQLKDGSTQRRFDVK